MSFGAQKYVTSERLTVCEVPVRKHRRTGKPAYDRRIQKKWIKRFGMRLVYTCYTLPDGTMIVHPEVLRQLRDQESVMLPNHLMTPGLAAFG